MYISARTLDDLLMRVLEKLLTTRNRVTPKRGGNVERIGVLLRLSNPRARLSRTETKGTVFSGLGEFLWYMSKGNSLRFVSYYISRYNEDSEDGKTVYGGYGPRFFTLHGSIDQIANVIALLKDNQSSRRAVIQLFDGRDIDGRRRKELPCTCTMQFLIRKERLHMVTNMRSNDAFWGLPHDIFAFTMLQEVLARSLNIEVGVYKHAVGSLHLYDKHVAKARQYVDEGWQENIPMPPMPVGDPWKDIQHLLKIESRLRNATVLPKLELNAKPYWADLSRLLQIYWHTKHGSVDKIRDLKSQMASQIYRPYIQRRQAKAIRHIAPEQLPLGLSRPPN